MDQIRSRGRLICGINGQLPGFSALETSGVYYGLDLDLCRAVAAAVLGDGSNWSCAP
jgi:general L-amino acid transport system substrate-binding protein